MGYSQQDLNAIVGKTLVSITGLEAGSDEARFVCTDGSEYRMVYHQDCCASCDLVDVVGDVSDLIGSPLLKAKESTNSDQPPPEGTWADSSYTWTFYSFRTVKGSVDVRWFGSSNGYYSEEASFEEVRPATPTSESP